MGGLKAGLPLGGSTVLGQCITLFQECGIEAPLVITGHRGDEVATIAGEAGAQVVHNPDFERGMYSSIRAGVLHLPKNSSGFFLLPVDIPLVQAATVKQMIRSFLGKESCRILYPSFDEERGHPPLIGKALLPTIIDCHNPGGGMRYLLKAEEKRHPQQVSEIEVPDCNILFDMDSPTDYETGLLRWQERDYPTPKECKTILQLHPMPEKGLAHGRLVGSIAATLCRAVQQVGSSPLQPQLCMVSGLLHDIAKGYPDHEGEGGRWIRKFGFTRAAEIIEAHKDIDWFPGMNLGEKELVHLADKLSRGSRMVGIKERFEEKLDLYRDNPEATKAIRVRHRKARQLAAAVEQQTGQTLDEILEGLKLPAPCEQ